MSTITTKPLLSLENVYKNFDAVEVIKDLSFSVQGGEVVALLGVNGAGKTTTINMMLGLEAPTKGKVYLNGSDPCLPQSRLNIGVTPQNTDFPQFIKVKEIIKFVQKHFPHAVSLETIVEQFDLSDILEKHTAVLSGGQKRRLAVALAFIGNPHIVFLDEPTTGLDVQSRKQIWQVIRSYTQQGATIFLTTHYLEEAEALATRVIMLQQGKIRIDSTVADIQTIAGVARICFNCAIDLPLLLYATHIEHVENKYTIQTNNPDQLIRELVQKNIPFQRLEIVRGSIESAFLMIADEVKS